MSKTAAEKAAEKTEELRLKNEAKDNNLNPSDLNVPTVNINDVKREWKEFNLVSIKLAKDYNEEGNQIPQDLTSDYLKFIKGEITKEEFEEIAGVTK